MIASIGKINVMMAGFSGAQIEEVEKSSPDSTLFKFMSCKSGKEILEAIKYNVDVLITSINLPDMNSHDLNKKLKTRRHARVPHILISDEGDVNLPEDFELYAFFKASNIGGLRCELLYILLERLISVLTGIKDLNDRALVFNLINCNGKTLENLFEIACPELKKFLKLDKEIESAK